MIKRILAALVTFGVIAVMAAPAGAATETQTWLNNPYSGCQYSSGTVQGQPPAPGSDYYVSYGVAFESNTNPCAPTTPYLPRPAGSIKVQVSLRCHSQVGGVYQPEHVVWTGNINSNPNNTGSASGGLPWSSYGTTYPLCESGDGGNTQLRTVVKAWYFNGIAYDEYDHTTHWVDQTI